MNPKRFLAPAIIFFGTLLLLAMFLPGLRPERPGAGVVQGTAAIGGAFDLIDQKGNAVSAAELKGKYSLVYFGFTNCPDVCPISLQTITQALNIAGPIGDEVQLVFITVDAERDTPKVMAEYTANFHPRFLALTGTAEQVRAAASAYRVYFQKAKQETPGDYMMEHSGFVYFMDRDGMYLTHFKPDATAEQIAARIRQELGPKR
ncbi:MAG: SCO family protein [Rhodospirillaceae bacterium]|nr:SCO family protein [Rhodospirillaceae bacterium]